MKRSLNRLVALAVHEPQKFNRLVVDAMEAEMKAEVAELERGESTGPRERFVVSIDPKIAAEIRAMSC